MNQVINLMHQHRSIRKYKADPVSDEMIKSIIQSGQQASTSSNLQLYSVVVTTNQQTRERLSALCGNQKHIRTAPVFLCWCADLSRMDRICQARGYDHQSGYVENFLLAVVDASIASQNAGLAAESLGLGICYIGGIRNNPEDIIQLFKLPPLVFPLVGMTLGWPRGDTKPKPRLPLDCVLSWEQYDIKNEDELLESYDRVMIESGIYTGRQVKVDSPKEIAEYGWREHSARRVSKVQRPHLRQVLENIGFSLK